MVVMTYKFDFFLDLYFLKHGVLGENRNPEETFPNFPIDFLEFWFPLLISILVAHVVLLKMLLLFFICLDFLVIGKYMSLDPYLKCPFV